MKRAALWAAALLSLACVAADAKVLVITGRNASDPSSDPAGWFGKQAVMLENVQTLQTLGVDYDVLQSSNQSCKTEYCRTGTFVYPGGRAVSYDAIIHLVSGVSLSNGTGYRADSLTLIGNSADQKYTRIPQIYISYNGIQMTESSACSTLSSHYDNTTLTNMGQVNYSPNIPTITYMAGVAKNASMTTGASSGASWPGGIRILVRSGIGAGVRQDFTISGVGDPRPVSWPDSLWQRINSQTPFGTQDSFIVMAKKMDNIPSCNGAAYIFINDHDNSENQRDHVPFLAALAYADSLVSGRILGTAKRTPMKWAFQIRGAFSRGTQLGIPTSTGGMTETDSTNFKATIDSIAALGVPVTVGVNIDSLGVYSNYDKRWWSRLPQAKYGVCQTTGTTDTTKVSATGGTASFQLPRDPFGRYRRRIAVGMSDWSDTSSIATLVRGCFWKLDSTFGSAKVDRILMAHGDDWSPVNYSSLPRDSVIYAMSVGGAKGLVVNPVNSLTRGVGYDAYSSRDPLIYNPSRGPFKLLVTEGAADSGSTRWDAATSSGAYLRSFYFAEKQWRAATGITNRPWYVPAPNFGAVYNSDAASFAGPEALKFPGTARIITIHCSDLQSGLRSDAAANPIRPGFRTMKNIVNGVKVINSFAYRGKPLIVFTYPEDIEP